MLIYSVDDDRSCRGLIEAIVDRFKNTSIRSFIDPFEMLKKLRKDAPSVIVIDYDFKGYRLPSGVFNHLGQLDSKFILVSGFDWRFINKDLKERGIDIPDNLEFIPKGNMRLFERLKELANPPLLAAV